MSVSVARKDLAAQLRDAQSTYVVHDHVPDQIEPPCLVIAPADGYLGGGQTFGDKLVQLDIWTLVPLGGDNAVIADQLDDALTVVLSSLGDWIETACGQPGPFETSEWAAHGVNLTVANQINLTTTEGASA